MHKKSFTTPSTILLSLLLASNFGAMRVQAEEHTDPELPTEPSVLNTSTPQETVKEITDSISQPDSIIKASEDTYVAPVEGQTVEVRVLSTTDLHTNLVNYDYYQDKSSQNLGLAKTAVLIEAAKAENGNVILVDNGDTIQGTPLGTYKSSVDPIETGEQHPMYAALTALGFDVGTLGNHEFNYGLDYLTKVINTAGMPLVNANVLSAQTNQPLYETHKIVSKTFKDTNGNPVTLKIGITGIVPPQILSWDKAHLEGKVVVRDAVEALTDLVPKIRQQGADIVLVLSHSGIGDDKYDKGEENVGYQIAGIPGVDAVVTGHSHAEFPTGGKGFYSRYAGVDDVNGLINGIPVTMGGKYGDHLGIIDLNLTYTKGKWVTNTAKGMIRKIDTKSETASEIILNLAKEAHEGTIAYVRQQVGTTTAPITSYFALVKDDPSIQMVNNAQIWYAKTELAGTPEANLPVLSATAPFKAGGRNFSEVTNYTDIPAGAIAIKNVADLYLYDNVTAILKITGGDLKEWLEMSAGQFNQIDPNKTEPQPLINPEFRTYNFDVIDGVTYQYDVTQPQKYDRNGKVINPETSRVRNLKYQGNDVKDDQEFIVVTNNYRASGNFPGVVNASINRLLNLENRQVIINYILAEKTINPSADNNWGFTDHIKNLDIRFLTADKAKNLVAGAKDLIYLKASETSTGFGEFRFVYTDPVAMPRQPFGNNQELSEQERQNIRQIVAQNYTNSAGTRVAGQASSPFSTKNTSTSLNTRQALPKTGSANTSLLSFIGLNLLGLSNVLSKKVKKD